MTSSKRVFLFVGAAKSGTTYLQQIMWDNRARLRDHGFLYPGSKWASQVYAALDLRRIRMGRDQNPEVPFAWRNLTDEVRDWDGHSACISQEMLAAASPQQVEQAMTKLSAFADVHIVWTARDMSRVLPASWQEWVRNRETDPYATYLEQVRAATPVMGPAAEGIPFCAREFWSLQNAPDILARWGAGLSPENVHVITVPPAGAPPSTLWDRFATVTGLQDVEVRTAERRANSSLTAAGAGLLRDLNIAIGGEKYPWRAYDAVLKHDITVRMSDVRGTRIDLPEPAYEWARTWAEHQNEQLVAAKYDVVGDLQELLPGTRPTGADPDAADPAERAEVGLVAMTNFARRAAGAESHIAGLDRAIEDMRRELREANDVIAEHRELPPVERIKRCVVELSRQVRWMRAALTAYRRLRRRATA